MKSLREGQHAVMRRVLDGHATLAVMPTGAGKSLCYQLPALLLPGKTVVVSPLIALMKDQCESLCERGVHAVQLNSALDAESIRSAEAAIADGSARIVLITPERLADPECLALLRRHATSLLVVDEAHCISQWGHDFRPAFLDIAPALKKLQRPTVLALTATATEAVTADIRQQLGIPHDGVVNTGAYRANLHYRVEQVARESDKLQRVLALVKASEGAGMVYTATVRAAEAVYQALADAGESVGRYHGKLAPSARHAAQAEFMEGRARVMVATNAFGLGIDKPDIRFVLHYQMPAGLDAYYQESGRAGRDGLDATCTLLFLRSDRAVQQFFMSGRYPAAEEITALYRALQAGPEPLSASTLQAQLHVPANKLKVALSVLRQQRIAGLDKAGDVILLKPHLASEALESVAHAYAAKRKQDKDALEGMVAYAQSGQCRWQALLAHLQEQDEPTRCGHCDNCQRIAALEAELAQRAQATVQALGVSSGKAPVHAGDAEPPAPRAANHKSSFQPGDAVKVRRYGKGHVLAADALSVTVAFDGAQTRVFQCDYVEAVRSRPRKSPARETPTGQDGGTARAAQPQ